MNPVYTHILIVHVPVVGALFSLTVVAVGTALRDRRIELLGCALTVVCAIAAAAAYGTGPPAYEALEPQMAESTRALAEQHALVGRGAFILTLLTGIVALQVLLRTAAAEMPSPWVMRGIVVLLLLLAGTLTWSAHLGGMIAHPEARGPTAVPEAGSRPTGPRPGG